MLKCPDNINFSALAATFFKNNLVILSKKEKTPPAVIINKGNPAITNSSINLFDENLLDDKSQGAELFVDELNQSTLLGDDLNDYRISNHIKVSDKLLLVTVTIKVSSTILLQKLNMALPYLPHVLVYEKERQNNGKASKSFIFTKSEFDIFQKLREVAITAHQNVFKNNKIVPHSAFDRDPSEENPSSENNYCIKQEFVDKYPEIAKYVSQRNRVEAVINQKFTKMTAVIDGMENIVV